LRKKMKRLLRAYSLALMGFVLFYENPVIASTEEPTGTPRKIVLWAPSHLPTEGEIEDAKWVFSSRDIDAVAHACDPDPDCKRIADTGQIFSWFLSLLTEETTPARKVLWAIRGGRMSLRFWKLLDELIEKDPSAVEKIKEKILLVGFSDVTSLHLWFNFHGIPSLHAPVAAFCKETGKGCGTETSLIDDVYPVVTGKKSNLQYTGLTFVNPFSVTATEVGSSVEICGFLTGGNLSSLSYWTSAYSSFPKDDHILLIETTGEESTRVMSILEAITPKILASTKAIIFGSLYNYGEETGAEAREEQDTSSTVNFFLRNIKHVPIFRTQSSKTRLTDLVFGHGFYNDPLPLGTSASLYSSEDGTFTLNVRGFERL
jgi:muramoyltetrapeptide carboxypeptidase LdcA involved in peptidoglycan recycling